MSGRFSAAVVALTNRNYRFFFCGQLVSLCGTWMQMMAMSWLTYRLTGSPALMGLAMFFTQAPSLILSPFAGARADRSNKRKALIIIQAAFLLQTATLATLTVSGRINVQQILVLAFIQGLITAYDFPFRQSLVPEMLDNPEHLQNAIALNSLVVNAARIIGPSIAGIIVARFGEGWCFMLNSISYIGAIIALLLMKIEFIKTVDINGSSRLKSIRSGFKYVWQHNSIRSVMAMLFVASFIGTSYMTLLPLLVQDALHGSAQDMGFLMAVTGAGAVISVAYLAFRKSVRGLDRLIGYAVGIAGLAFVALGRCNALVIAYSIMPVIGMMLTFQMASSNTFIQYTTKSVMRGRVMGIYALIWNGISPFGNLLYGFAAEFIGAQWTIAAGGVVMVLSAGAFFMLSKPDEYSEPLI